MKKPAVNEMRETVQKPKPKKRSSAFFEGSRSKQSRQFQSLVRSDSPVRAPRESRRQSRETLEHKATEIICTSVAKEATNTKTGIALRSSTNQQKVVSRISEQGLFAASDVRVGDVVISVNNVVCSNLTTKETAKLISNAMGVLTLVLQRKMVAGKPDKKQRATSKKNQAKPPIASGNTRAERRKHQDTSSSSSSIASTSDSSLNSDRKVLPKKQARGVPDGHSTSRGGVRKKYQGTSSSSSNDDSSDSSGNYKKVILKKQKQDVSDGSYSPPKPRYGAITNETKRPTPLRTRKSNQDGEYSTASSKDPSTVRFASEATLISLLKGSKKQVSLKNQEAARSKFRPAEETEGRHTTGLVGILRKPSGIRPHHVNMGNGPRWKTAYHRRKWSFDTACEIVGFLCTNEVNDDGLDNDSSIVASEDESDTNQGGKAQQNPAPKTITQRRHEALKDLLLR